MPSPREDVAQRLLETCIFGGLNQVYGGTKDRVTENGKTFWSILFCKARILDGRIRVYSPVFILIEWETAIRKLEPRGRKKFSNEQEAKEFLMAFINI